MIQRSTSFFVSLPEILSSFITVSLHQEKAKLETDRRYVIKKEDPQKCQLAVIYLRLSIFGKPSIGKKIQGTQIVVVVMRLTGHIILKVHLQK